MAKSVRTITCCLIVMLGFMSSCSNRSKYPDELTPVMYNGLCGYVDLKGDFVIEPQFEEGDFFYDDVAMVMNDGNVGYINKKGEYVIEPQYRCGTLFGNDRAFVMRDEGATIECIDKKGNSRFPFPLARTIWCFEDGLACFSIPYYFKEGLSYGDSVIGFVDTKGVIHGEPEYNDCMSFREGLAAVQKNGRWGFVDKDGVVRIPFRYSSVGSFYEELSTAAEVNLWGAIDKKGEWVVKPQFDEMATSTRGVVL